MQSGTTLTKYVTSAVMILVILAFALAAAGQEVLDHTICGALPPLDRATEYTAADGHLYSWVNFGPIEGTQELTWRFIAPDGSLWQEAGPVTVGVDGATYATAPVAQELLLSQETPRGDWRVEVLLNGTELVTDRFSVGAETILGDYGDAPDGLPCGYSGDADQDVVGRFPTRHDTESSRIAQAPGAHAASTRELALGSPLLTSRELGAADPADPDRTPNLVDDDTDDGLLIELLPSGGIEFKVAVSRRAESSAGVCYLNALYDLNRDGEWQQTAFGREWIVMNDPIDLAPGEEMLVELPIPLDRDWTKTLSEPRWLRLALTSVPIDESAYNAVGGWDGSGAFAVGEIEDHKIGAASVADVERAIRHAYQQASAAAFARAGILAWNLSGLIQTTSAIAFDVDSAYDYARAADSARDRASAHAYDVDRACAAAEDAAGAAAYVIAATPCGSIRASASASVEASASACASARSWATASSTAAADAGASASAWAESAALAFSRAKAASVAFSAAAADAWASAASFSEAQADAKAWAEASASVIGLSSTDPTAVALALAWADAHVRARAWAATAVGVEVGTMTFTYVETIAEAFAGAYAAARAAAQAAAQADAWATAAANATAIASASADAIAAATASIQSNILTDCCDEIVPEPEPCDCPECEETPCPAVTCPPCEPTPCPTVSCPPCERTVCPEVTCPDCPSCPPCVQRECPEVTCPDCPTCPSCPACPSCDDTETQSKWGIPGPIIDDAHNLAWFAGDRSSSRSSWRWEASEWAPQATCGGCGGEPMCIPCMEFDLSLLSDYCCLSSSMRAALSRVQAFLGSASSREKEALASIWWGYHWDGYHDRNEP